jgi:K+-sensing histidine kinase KdpD
MDHPEDILGFLLMRMVVIVTVTVVMAMAVSMRMAMVMGVVVLMIVMVLAVAMAMIMTMITISMAGMVVGMAVTGRYRSCIIKPEFRHRVTDHTSQSADSCQCFPNIIFGVAWQSE